MPKYNTRGLIRYFVITFSLHCIFFFSLSSIGSLFSNEPPYEIFPISLILGGYVLGQAYVFSKHQLPTSCFEDSENDILMRKYIDNTEYQRRSYEKR